MDAGGVRHGNPPISKLEDNGYICPLKNYITLIHSDKFIGLFKYGIVK